MNFNDSPDDANFRNVVQQWLKRNTQDFAGYDYNNISEDEELLLSRKWIAQKAAAGYAAMRLPAEYGGMNASPTQCAIFAEEESKYPLPRNFFDITLGTVVPTLMSFASEEQKKDLIPKILKGEDLWCQLFSEPSAGSDLAGIRTSAKKEGDNWIINGQKVWTTKAQYAKYGIILARSDFSLPKHRGLTFFFVDMASPGVEVRPIKQLDGGSEFNEVYFSNVRLRYDQRLGKVGEGFRVALLTLSFERQAAGEQSLGLIDFDDMLNFVKSIDLEDGPAIDDSSVIDALVDWYLVKEGLKFFGYRQLSALSRGKVPGPEASVGKLLEAKAAQEAAKFCMGLIGPTGACIDASRLPMGGVMQAAVLRSPGIRIAGGTDEILRNTISEHVLKMPKEDRNDKEIPFNQLK